MDQPHATRTVPVDDLRAFVARIFAAADRSSFAVNHAASSRLRCPFDTPSPRTGTKRIESNWQSDSKPPMNRGFRGLA